MRQLGRATALVVAILATCAALGGCALLVAEGRCEVTGFEQPYYQSLGEYSDYVEVFYKVTNTGSIEIDYYKAYFEVRCADGSAFQDWTNGIGVNAGTYVTDSMYVNVGGKQAVSVTVTSFEVESY
jgi:hypothetical protein